MPDISKKTDIESEMNYRDFFDNLLFKQAFESENPSQSFASSKGDETLRVSATDGVKSKHYSHFGQKGDPSLDSKVEQLGHKRPRFGQTVGNADGQPKAGKKN